MRIEEEQGLSVASEQQHEEQNYFQALPDETVLNIFSFLNTRRDLEAVQCVDRRFNSLGKNALENQTQSILMASIATQRKAGVEFHMTFNTDEEHVPSNSVLKITGYSPNCGDCAESRTSRNERVVLWYQKPLVNYLQHFQKPIALFYFSNSAALEKTLNEFEQQGSDEKSVVVLINPPADFINRKHYLSFNLTEGTTKQQFFESVLDLIELKAPKDTATVAVEEEMVEQETNERICCPIS